MTSVLRHRARSNKGQDFAAFRPKQSQSIRDAFKGDFWRHAVLKGFSAAFIWNPYEPRLHVERLKLGNQARFLCSAFRHYSPGGSVLGLFLSHPSKTTILDTDLNVKFQTRNDLKNSCDLRVAS